MPPNAGSISLYLGRMLENYSFPLFSQYLWSTSFAPVTVGHRDTDMKLSALTLKELKVQEVLLNGRRDQIVSLSSLSFCFLLVSSGSQVLHLLIQQVFVEHLGCAWHWLRAGTAVHQSLQLVADKGREDMYGG